MMNSAELNGEHSNHYSDIGDDFEAPLLEEGLSLAYGKPTKEVSRSSESQRIVTSSEVKTENFGSLRKVPSNQFTSLEFNSSAAEVYVVNYPSRHGDNNVLEFSQNRIGLDQNGHVLCVEYIEDGKSYKHLAKLDEKGQTEWVRLNEDNSETKLHIRDYVFSTEGGVLETEIEEGEFKGRRLDGSTFTARETAGGAYMQYDNEGRVEKLERTGEENEESQTIFHYSNGNIDQMTDWNDDGRIVNWKLENGKMLSDDGQSRTEVAVDKLTGNLSYRDENGEKVIISGNGAVLRCTAGDDQFKFDKEGRFSDVTYKSADGSVNKRYHFSYVGRSWNIAAITEEDLTKKDSFVASEERLNSFGEWKRKEANGHQFTIRARRSISVAGELTRRGVRADNQNGISKAHPVDYILNTDGTTRIDDDEKAVLLRDIDNAFKVSVSNDDETFDLDGKTFKARSPNLGEIHDLMAALQTFHPAQLITEDRGVKIIFLAEETDPYTLGLYFNGQETICIQPRQWITPAVKELYENIYGSRLLPDNILVDTIEHELSHNANFYDDDIQSADPEKRRIATESNGFALAQDMTNAYQEIIVMRDKEGNLYKPVRKSGGIEWVEISEYGEISLDDQGNPKIISNEQMRARAEQNTSTEYFDNVHEKRAEDDTCFGRGSADRAALYLRSVDAYNKAKERDQKTIDRAYGPGERIREPYYSRTVPNTPENRAIIEKFEKEAKILASPQYYIRTHKKI